MKRIQAFSVSTFGFWLLSSLCAVVSSTQWEPVGDSLYGDTAFDQFGYAIDLSFDGKTIVVGATRNSESKGYVEVFRLDDLTWRTVHGPILGDEIDDSFGYSVSISNDGTRIAVGAPHGVRKLRGYMKVFSDNGNSWDALMNIRGTKNNNLLGSCVSLSGDGKTVAVGTPKNDINLANDGSIEVYRENSVGTWSQVHTSIAGLARQERLGLTFALSEDGKTLAAGSPRFDKGQARVYRDESNGWILVATFSSSIHSTLGGMVAISDDGNTVAVGGHSHTPRRAGVVRVFRAENGVWNQVHESIHGTQRNDGCGSDVKLSSDGKKLAFACNYGDGSTLQPKIKVYEEGISRWIQVNQMIIEERAGDQWGLNVALSGDAFILAGGGFGEDSQGTRSGYVRVFTNGSFGDRYPTAFPTSSPTLFPTSSPTDSPTQNPTSFPTSFPTLYPTASPTASPTLVPTASPIHPTSSPTFSPTEGPLEEFFITSKAFKKANSSNVITMETHFGNLTEDASIKILKKGCDGDVSNGAITIHHTKNITETEKTMTSEITVHKSKLDGSNALIPNGNQPWSSIEFCIETIAYVFQGAENAISVISNRSEYIITASVDFTIESIHGETIVTDTYLDDDDILDLGVDFVRCSKDSNLEYIAPPEANVEGEQVYLCLTPYSDSTSLSDMNLLIGYGNQFFPLVISSTPSLIASIETRNTTTRIGFQIIAEFFNSDNRNLQIVGNVDVGLAGLPVKFGSDDDSQNVNLRLNIQLADTTKTGCFGSMLKSFLKNFS